MEASAGKMAFSLELVTAQAKRGRIAIAPAGLLTKVTHRPVGSCLAPIDAQCSEVAIAQGSAAAALHAVAALLGKVHSVQPQLKMVFAISPSRLMRHADGRWLGLLWEMKRWAQKVCRDTRYLR